MVPVVRKIAALLACVLAGAGCGLDVNGADYFPADAATDVAPPPVDAGPDGAGDARSPAGGKTPYSLAAGATVCTSPHYRVVVTTGAGAGDERVITSPSYKVKGALAGVSP
jgi:hypothetical protein